MTQQITIEIKSVYGRELAYPVCEMSKLLTQLTTKKTLDGNDLELIRALGYNIKLKEQTLEI